MYFYAIKVALARTREISVPVCEYVPRGPRNLCSRAERVNLNTSRNNKLKQVYMYDFPLPDGHDDNIREKIKL